jgi:hypothetical protein
MKYCIDQDNRKITLHLAAKDRLGYNNVPLSRAIIRKHPEERLGGKYLTFNQDDGSSQPTASYNVQTCSETTDQEAIVQIGRDAQRWLSDRISSLQELRDNLEIIKEAEYAHGQDPKAA